MLSYFESSDRIVNGARGHGDELVQQIQHLKQIVSSDTMMDGAEYKENAPADPGLMAFRRNVQLQLKSSF